MFKAKQKIRSILLACLTTLFAFVLALGVFSVMPKVTVNAADTTVVATFEFGANGSASHADGTEKTSYTETNNGYTLTLSGMSKAYTGARDAKGNSCIKLGTSSAVGKFSFTVPNDVTSVVIYIAKYKANSSKVTVNSTSYTLTKNSTNGEYDAITVDTDSTKTINFATVSGACRAMVNTIEFAIADNGGSESTACEHTNTTPTEEKSATCTEAGNIAYWTCNECKAIFSDAECRTPVNNTTISATGHSYGEPQETEAPTCTTAGEETSTCATCGDKKTEAIPATGHNYVDGVCSVCNEEQPNEETATLTFDANKTNRTSFSTTKQVWEQNGITFTNNKGSGNAVADYANPVRLYAGSEIIIAHTSKAITKIEFACNTSAYATTLKNSIGSDATVNSELVTVEFSAVETFTIAKLTGQVRMDSITVTFIPSECNHENATVTKTPATCTEPGSETTTCECGYENIKELPATGHVNQTKTTVEANCTETGSITVTCDDCKEIISTSVIPASHNYVDGACSVCQEEQPVKATLTFDNKGKRTEFSTEKQVWQENGITITNNKAESTTPVADYAAPVRFYKNSEIVITYSGLNIKKIEFTCNSNSYATLLQASIGDNATATVDGKVVTITLNSATSEYTFVHTGNVVHVDSITVYTVQGAALNEVQSYMQLSYQYNTATNENGAVVLKDSAFRLRFAVDASLANIEGVDECGIFVKDENGKTKFYNLADSDFVMTDENGKYYVVIDLGDTDNNPTRLSTGFTVCAYIKIGNTEYYSDLSKTYSVAGMVKDYYEELGITAVEHLYNYLFPNNVNEEEE